MSVMPLCCSWFHRCIFIFSNWCIIMISVSFEIILTHLLPLSSSPTVGLLKIPSSFFCKKKKKKYFIALYLWSLCQQLKVATLSKKTPQNHFPTFLQLVWPAFTQILFSGGHSSVSLVCFPQQTGPTDSTVVPFGPNVWQGNISLYVPMLTVMHHVKHCLPVLSFKASLTM